jgi:hypothetical protein
MHLGHAFLAHRLGSSAAAREAGGGWRTEQQTVMNAKKGMLAMLFASM